MPHGNGFRVHRSDRAGLPIRKNAAESTSHENGCVGAGNGASRNYFEVLRHVAQKLREHTAHHLACRRIGANRIEHFGRHRRHVHGGRDDRPFESGHHMMRNLHARATLRLVSGSAQMGSEDGVLELMQGAFRARLRFEHVYAHGADFSRRDEIGQRIDVVYAPARDVQKNDAVFHGGVARRTEHAYGLLGLR